MKQTMIIVLLLALALAGALNWLQPTVPEQEHQAEQNTGLPADPLQVLDNEFTGRETQSEGDEPLLPDLDARPVARRIVNVPPNDQAPRYDNIDEIDESELAAFTHHNLDEALTGTLAAANRVVHALRRCAGAPSSAADVEREVRRTLQRLTWSRESRPRNRPLPTEAEIRARSTAQFENCRFREQLFNADLRAQLERLANQGQVAARYLYALWPPETLGRPDAFLRHQEWSEKALAFTLANLTLGEPAGLLAFGQSYANSGLFTATDRYLGTAFIIAAIDCGLDLEYYVSFVENFLNSGRYAQARPEVLVMADGLKTFCL